MKPKSIASPLFTHSHQAFRASAVHFASAVCATAADFTRDGGGGDNKATTPANRAAETTSTDGGKAYEWNATSSIVTAIVWDLAVGINSNNFTFIGGSPAYSFTGNKIQFVGAVTALANTSGSAQTIANNIQIFFNSVKTFDANTAGLALGSVGFRGDRLVPGNINTLNLTGTWTLSGVSSNPGVSGAFGLNGGIATANIAGATIGLGVGAASPQFVSANVDILFAGSPQEVTNDIASAARKA